MYENIFNFGKSCFWLLQTSCQLRSEWMSTVPMDYSRKPISFIIFRALLLSTTVSFYREKV